MSKKITIDPVTRVEGHGRVTIHLDDAGRVADTRFHIVEFRGFERFIQGHPYWEAPALVQRLCGICPVSHHLAAAKAVDRLEGLEPEDLSPAANLQRRLAHYGQMFQSHALHFFYLAAPDLLFGIDAPAAQRNVAALAMADQSLARKGIHLMARTHHSGQFTSDNFSTAIRVPEEVVHTDGSSTLLCVVVVILM
ncbi:MAG: nickel-dependent hydrogenase large subunit [Haliscomenobacter sp.]